MPDEMAETDSNIQCCFVTIRLGFPQPESTHYALFALIESESEKFHKIKSR